MEWSQIKCCNQTKLSVQTVSHCIHGYHKITDEGQVKEFHSVCKSKLREFDFTYQAMDKALNVVLSVNYVVD